MLCQNCISHQIFKFMVLRFVEIHLQVKILNLFLLMPPGHPHPLQFLIITPQRERNPPFPQTAKSIQCQQKWEGGKTVWWNLLMTIAKRNISFVLYMICFCPSEFKRLSLWEYFCKNWTLKQEFYADLAAFMALARSVCDWDWFICNTNCRARLHTLTPHSN